MATKTMIEGNAYITTGTVSGDTITHDSDECVEIWSVKIEYNLQNQLKSAPIPVSKGNRGTKVPFQRIIDLKRINEVISITGHFEDEDSESAKNKWDNLIDLAKNEGALTFVTGVSEQLLWKPASNGEYGVFIEKFNVTKTEGKVSESSSDTTPNRKLDIQITLVRGKDM